MTLRGPAVRRCALNTRDPASAGGRGAGPLLEVSAPVPGWHAPIVARVAVGVPVVEVAPPAVAEAPETTSRTASPDTTSMELVLALRAPATSLTVTACAPAVTNAT